MIIHLKRSFLALLIFALLPTLGQAQRWKKYRMEVGGSLGTSFFLSDVGGYQDVPKNNLGDLNFKSTRLSGGGNFNYFLRQDMSVNAGLTYCMLTAKDQFAANDARRNRNFDIRTHLYELSLNYRYYFVKDKFGHAFRLRGTKTPILSAISSYVTVGVGGIFFNPTGKHSDGKFYPLQPLGTEGQGLPGGPDKYKRLSMVIPVGVGARVAITSQLSIGAEISARYTFTDYLDDVSTIYYDNKAIGDAYGEKAAFLADPNDGTNPTWTNPGERRGGDKNDDFYMTFLFNANYKILKGKSFKPRF